MIIMRIKWLEKNGKIKTNIQRIKLALDYLYNDRFCCQTEMKMRMLGIAAVRLFERSEYGTVPFRIDTTLKRIWWSMCIGNGVKNVPTFVRSLTPLQRIEATNFPSLPTRASNSIMLMTPMG